MKELIVQLKHWLLLNLAEKRCAVHCEKEITTELDLSVPGQVWVGLAGPQTQLGEELGGPSAQTAAEKLPQALSLGQEPSLTGFVLHRRGCGTRSHKPACAPRMASPALS